MMFLVIELFEGERLADEGFTLSKVGEEVDGAFVCGSADGRIGGLQWPELQDVVLHGPLPYRCFVQPSEG